MAASNRWRHMGQTDPSREVRGLPVAIRNGTMQQVGVNGLSSEVRIAWCSGKDKEETLGKGQERHFTSTKYYRDLCCHQVWEGTRRIQEGQMGHA